MVLPGGPWTASRGWRLDPCGALIGNPNAGGVKIDPTVLDLFARAHPNVVDAASFTYASKTGIDQVGIALVSEDDLDVAALIQELKKKFGEASPKLVARVTEIPRNATGKPLRLELAEKYEGRA
jgi:acyl-CoA synthetase (AMP-forming)/AMP-acid ligase II